MRIVYADICKNCGESIHYRNKVQGWLHANEDSRCMPMRAEPRSGRKCPDE